MTATLKLVESSSYHALDVANAVEYLARLPNIQEKLGGNPRDWAVKEVGDGNLNLVFIIEGLQGSIIAKQALPYVRMVGDSWPLPLYRAHYEQMALSEQFQFVPQRVPSVYYYDEPMALIVMEYLAPHTILRKELIAGNYFPQMAMHMGEFLASTLFHTSDLNLSAEAKRQKMTPYLGNIAMCKITEDLIFDEPYFAAPMNRYTTPYLDDIVMAFQGDTALKLAVQEMKWRFLNAPEALCHGDLHTGSIMVTNMDTRVIDPEFAFYGPIGFDVGMLLANFLMAYYAQDGHAEIPHERDDYKNWILDMITETYGHFIARFTQLWQSRAGEAYQARVMSTAEADSMLQSRLKQIWQDVLGFCGVEIIRRILGLAHVADFEAIKNPGLRANCERKALLLGREMLINRPRFQCYSDLHGVITA